MSTVLQRSGPAVPLLPAEADVAQARLRLDWCRVTAPIPGRISRHLVDPGNIVTAGTTVLATIVNDATVHACFSVAERGVLELREQMRRRRRAAGQDATTEPDLRELHWPVQLDLLTESGHPHEGVLDYAAPQLDPATGTVQVRAAFDNARGLLLPGLFVRVRIPSSAPYEALTVTERALGSDQGQRYLLAVNDQNVVEYRAVQVGPLQDGARVILAGVRADDWIIVNGIQRVRPGVNVTPVRAPMPTAPAAVPAAAPASAPAGPDATRPAAR